MQPSANEDEADWTIVKWGTSRLVRARQMNVYGATLYADYIGWAAGKGQAKPIPWQELCEFLKAMGYQESVTATGRTRFDGVGLKADEPQKKALAVQRLMARG